jgi:prepilin-type N-terminal cleavage/methylation domain-containing protein
MPHKLKAFTLMELLVVISIMALILAMLLPALSPARESGRRAKCASNQRQLVMALTAYADFNKGFFLSTSRAGAGSTATDHVSWVHKDTFEYFYEEINQELTVFTCPNRGAEFVLKSGNRYRIGYYFFFGRNESIWNHGGLEPWKSARRIDDSAGLEIIGDIIEEATVTPAISSASHGSRGRVTGAASLTPQMLGSQGGNIVFSDMSVRFRTQADMFRRAASSGQVVKGYW